MWVRYQQAASKMASFNPRDLVKSKEENTVKYPIKRFEPTLRTSLQIAIPTNLQRLKKHRSNIEKFMNARKWKDLNMEQINASRTVQQLQATIRELENVKNQVNNNDLDEFEKRIAPMREEAIAAIKEFVALHNKMESQHQNSMIADKDDTISDAPGNSNYCGDPLSCQLSTSEDTDSSNVIDHVDIPMGKSIQVQDHRKNQEEIAACQSWDHLKDGLIELNTLVKDFAAVVHNQQEVVDRIEDNVESAQENVSEATTLLGQASKYKAAAIPIAGAIVGGLIGGPIGLMAGFKLAGAAAAVGGGVAGYTGGKYLKDKHDNRVDVELSHLSKNDVNNPRPE